MANQALNLMAGLAFTVALCTAGQAVAAEDDSVALVLHLDNYARISPAHLARAEAVVTRTYAASGVRVVWVNGEAPTTLAPGHLRVLLLCADMSARKVSLDSVGDNVLGQAAKESGRAHIFTMRVRDIAIARAQDFDLMLGRVIAHEVGHLLLPPNSHSATGIMRESLDLATRRFEAFTPAQGSQLQLALR